MAKCPECGRAEGVITGDATRGGLLRRCERCGGSWAQLPDTEMRCLRCGAMIDSETNETGNVRAGQGCRACRELG
jgi:transcription elongation factor Elf1